MVIFSDSNYDCWVDGVVVAYVVRVIPENIYVVPGSNPGSPHFFFFFFFGSFLGGNRRKASSSFSAM